MNRFFALRCFLRNRGSGPTIRELSPADAAFGDSLTKRTISTNIGSGRVRLGHSDTKINARLYSQALPADDQRATDVRVASLMEKSSEFAGSLRSRDMA